MAVVVVGLVAGGCPWWSAEGGESIQVISDPEIADLLVSWGQPLLAASGMVGQDIEYHVILNGTLNAMALPNRHIVFHSGLVTAAQNRDELAGVMAHELAHLSAGHHAKTEAELKGISLRTMIGMAIGMAAGVASKRGDVAQAAMMGSNAAGVSELLESMRQNESQADRLAVQYLAQAGFDPEGMAAFLERLGRDQRLTSLPPPYLLTHPISSSRLMECRDLAKRTRPKGAPQGADNRRLARVQAKLLAAVATDPDEQARVFREQLKKDPGNQAVRYGLAVALRYGGQLAEAESLFTAMAPSKGGSDPYLLRERALTRLERNNLAGAEADLQLALQSKPRDPDLRYRMAFVLSESRQYAQSARLLRQLTQEREEMAGAHFLLARVEENQGHTGSSRLSLARYHRLNLDLENAKWHYRQALEVLPESSPEGGAARRELDDILKKEKEGFWNVFRPGTTTTERPKRRR